MRTLAMSIFDSRKHITKVVDTAFDNENIRLDTATWPAALQAIYDHLYVIKYHGAPVLDHRSAVNDYHQLAILMKVFAENIPIIYPEHNVRARELIYDAKQLANSDDVYEKNNIWNGYIKKNLFEAYPIWENQFASSIQNGDYRHKLTYKLCMYKLGKKLK